MAKSRSTRAREQTQALEALRGILPPGETVYTQCSHVTQKGKQRVHAYVVREGRIESISALVAVALDLVQNKRDRGFTLAPGMERGGIVEALSYALHGTSERDDGHKAGETLTHIGL